MPWDKEAERGLPPQHHREPSSLRRDIIDELTDHLAFAAEREMEAAGHQAGAGHNEEATILKRVLDQFGDPSTIARNLWWGAMKETIMRDRIQFALVIILCLSVLGFMGLFYRQMQTTNQAMLAALQDQPAAPGNSNPSLEIHIHRGSIDGPPAQGISATLSGRAFNEEKSIVEDSVDDLGIVKFGPVRPDAYQIFYTDSITGFHGSQKIPLFAGEGTKTIHVVAPKVEPRSIKFELPAMSYVDPAYQAVVLELGENFNHGTTEWYKNHMAALDNGILYGLRNIKIPSNERPKLAIDGDRTLDTSSTYETLGETIEFFGERVRIGNVHGVFKNTVSNSFQYYTVTTRNSGHFVNNLSFGTATIPQEYDISATNIVPLKLTESFKITYPYFTRVRYNEFGNLPDQNKWFVHEINSLFPEYVIHDARLVEKCVRVEEKAPNNYHLRPIWNDDEFRVQGSRGGILSFENFPDSIPQNGKVFLCLTNSGRNIVDSDAALRLYSVSSPIEFKILERDGILDVELELAADPILQVPARMLENVEGRVWPIELTSWVLSSDGLNDTTGIILDFPNESRNFLTVEFPNLYDNIQPVWVVLKPYKDAVSMYGCHFCIIDK
jgi:hypothetical protein